MDCHPMSNTKIYKWSLIERATGAVLNFGGNIVLARLLTTADFGLLAMLSLFIAIAQDLSSCGLSDGLIHKHNPTPRDYSTVFVFNAGFGLLFGLSFFFGAVPLARFFGHQELVGIMRVLGVCFFFQTMTFVQETKLRKELEMKKICFVKVGATLTALTFGITLAALGFGYWALVCTQILLFFFIFVYYLAASRWFPRIGFSTESFKEMFSFGIHLVLAYIGNIIGKNINTFVLGKFYAPATTGVYYQGAKLANVPFAVSESSINPPLFVLASNEDDKIVRRRVISEMLGVVIGINCTLLFLMLVVAGPAVAALYGSRWSGAVPVFRILALFECVYCVKAFFQTTCKVYGRTVFIRNMSFAEVGLQLLLLAVFFHHGILWIAWTQVGAALASTAVYALLFSRLTEQKLRSIIATAARSIWLPGLAMVASIGAAVAVSSLIEIPVLAMCAIIGIVYAVAFIGAGEVSRPRFYMTLRSRVIPGH